MAESWPVFCGPADGRKIRVLFLDDMAWRHTEFAGALWRRGVENVEIHRAWTADEAIELLGRMTFDQVFLDHDLSEDDIMIEVGEESEVGTGMDVVDHIVAMTSPPQDVVVHSMNGPARAEMCRRLEDAGLARVRNLDFYSLLKLMVPGRY